MFSREKKKKSTVRVMILILFSWCADSRLRLLDPSVFPFRKCVECLWTSRALVKWATTTWRIFHQYITMLAFSSWTKVHLYFTLCDCNEFVCLILFWFRAWFVRFFFSFFLVLSSLFSDGCRKKSVAMTTTQRAKWKAKKKVQKKIKSTFFACTLTPRVWCLKCQIQMNWWRKEQVNANFTKQKPKISHTK